MGGAHSRLNLADGRAPNDQAGTASHHAVPHRPGFMISGIVRAQKFADTLTMQDLIDSVGGSCHHSARSGKSNGQRTIKARRRDVKANQRADLYITCMSE